MYAYWQLRTSSQKLYHFYFFLLIACEFYNLICYRRVWQLEMHLLHFCTRHCDLLGVCHNKLIEKTQTTVLYIH